MKGRSLNAKKAQERDIIAHLDQHKRRNVNHTKARSHERACKFAETDSSSQLPSSSVPASSSIVKVDTHSRIMCLNPKPVIKQEDNLSNNDLQPIQRPGSTTAVPQCGCPNDRYDFYRTFSTLIRFGNAPKKEKEPKGGGGSVFGCGPYSRQISSEQELWQTHLCDLIWFELQLPVIFTYFVIFSTWLFLLKTFKALNSLLCADVPLRNYSLTQLQAYINVRTNKDQDDFLCEARNGINGMLERVMGQSQRQHLHINYHHHHRQTLSRGGTSCGAGRTC